KYADLVCEGGGVKGIGLAGAYSMLEEKGYEAKNVAGTSAGAITAALIAAGYRADELKEIIVSLDYREFQDKGWEDKLPVIDRSASILLDLGIYEGKRFHEWMKEMLEAKGIRTFRDLVVKDETDPKYRSKLQVIASDVTGRRLLVLPQDAVKLGYKDPDDLEVAFAVRMSMSIPIFFEPVRVENKDTDTEHVIVDGGMLSNFPVWLFDCEPGEEPEWPTFGLLLVEPEPKKPIGHRLEKDGKDRGVSAMIDYVKAMAQTMMEAHDRLYLEKEQFARTIPIPTLGVGTTEFGITRERALALYESGRRATEEFLKDWDFDRYVAEFRQGKTFSRREELVTELRRVPAGAR
ncbi:MAG TPA: patatin-like phospholipase family protein, partial [Gaiellaceae bacterium]|nr:patatin-like phospholipase family protein [Gaiellaceae bacterium]